MACQYDLWLCDVVLGMLTQIGAGMFTILRSVNMPDVYAVVISYHIVFTVRINLFVYSTIYCD